MRTGPDRRFEQGLESFRQADYQAAIRIWSELLIEGHPDPNLPLYLWAARSEYGRMLGAVDQFAETLDDAGGVETEPSALSLARKAARERRFQEALDLLRAELNRDPEARVARRVAARVALSCGLLAESERYVEEALRLEPDDPELITLKGQVLAEADRPDQAAALFRRALALSDDLAPAWFGLASLAYHQGRLAEAERLLERISRRSSSTGGAASFLSEVRQEKSRVEAGLTEARGMLENHPKYPDWQHRRAVLAWRLGQDKEAMEALDLALKLNPAMPGSWHQKGLMLAQNGDPRGACQAFRRAAELAEGTDEDLRRRAEALEQSEDPGEAARVWIKAFRLTPDHASRHIETGKRFHAEGLLDEGERELRRGLSLAPHYPDGHFHLGQIELDRGNSAEAIGHFKNALAHGPRFSEAALALVSAFLADDNHAAALHTLDQWRGSLESNAQFASRFSELENRARQSTGEPRSPEPEIPEGTGSEQRQP